MSAPQPLTGDELATIKAQTGHRAQWGDDAHAETVLRLVAEVERLRAQVERVEALAEHFTQQARGMSIVGGESPRPNDYSEGHHVGVMRSYEIAADDIRAALAWDE